MPGTNKTSAINGNVTATLTSKTDIDGVPELVSVLRIISASQNSVITCDSITNRSVARREFTSGTCIYVHNYYTLNVVVCS